MPSDVQVFVRFREQSVFAGEEIQSIITFKNVANVQEGQTGSKPWQSRDRGSLGESLEDSRQGSPGDTVLRSRNPRLAAVESHGAQKTLRSGHRATASLNIPSAGSNIARSSSWTVSPVVHSSSSHRHQRSVSIISLGSPDTGNGQASRPSPPPRSRSTIGHSRSASAQVHPGRRGGMYERGPSTFKTPPLHGTVSTAGTSSNDGLGKFQRTDSQAGSSRISALSSQDESVRHSPSAANFKFTPFNNASILPVSKGQKPPCNSGPCPVSEQRLTVGNSRSDSLGPTSRVLSGTSASESNRSSADFHSISDHSQETTFSEQASVVPIKSTFGSPMMKQYYKMDSTARPKRAYEKLLMGYAQVTGTFTLDGALVDQSPFEEVKRKGFVGGQGGGGVVGVKTPPNVGGLFAGFNLNSIGESIGGLLGGGELSSLKEMKGVASSRAIPLLTAPQSLLFVDLMLLPGEEKSYSFRYALPQGLPASYKGKAFKIAYNLSIGVQGTPGEKSVQTIRRVNVPFKVYSGVNSNGEVYGHDLMQPYVILQDCAHTEEVAAASPFSRSTRDISTKEGPNATQDFLNYVDTLLTKNRRRQSSSATLEAPSGLTKTSNSNGAKEAIEHAIFLNKQLSASDRTPNRFEIARNGKRIGLIVLDRTLYRVGETVTACIDMSEPQMPCYSLRCTLETTEKVNPALALRSAASIMRLTRRIHRSQSENTIFATRVVFSPSIPLSATPTLLTSGVNLDWGLRFEFVTTKSDSDVDETGESAGNELLEEVANDSRGSIMAAVETLRCETFDVTIPISVYGDTVLAGTEAEGTIGQPI